MLVLIGTSEILDLCRIDLGICECNLDKSSMVCDMITSQYSFWGWSCLSKKGICQILQIRMNETPSPDLPGQNLDEVTAKYQKTGDTGP
jgi:hypothetical protein